MLEKLKACRKYVPLGIATIIVGITLMIAFKIISNSTDVVSSSWIYIKQFIEVISPVIYAFAGAYLLYYPVQFIEKWLNYGLDKAFPKRNKEKNRGWIRLLSVAAVFLMVIGLTIMLINFILPPFLDNISILIASLPKLEAQFNLWMKEIGNFLASLNVDEFNTLIPGDVFNYIKEVLINGGQWVLGGIGRFISSFSSFVVDFVVTVILTFYFLKDKEVLFAGVDKIGTIVFKPRTKEHIKDFIRTLDNVVGKYLLGTILDSAIVGGVSVFLMILIKHPFAILIGVAAGITNVIPYVGPIVGSGLAFILGSFTSVGMGLTGAVLLLLYQQIDGNIIQPKIVGDQVGLLPVWILISVLIGGSYFGGVGMIASVPVAALIKVYLDRLYSDRIESKKRLS